MSAVDSSSTRKPIDTISSVPGAAPASAVLGTSRWWGTILPSSPPSRPSTPSMRGTLKPQMSASSTPTRSPRAASAAARFTVTELLPTPPLPLDTASTRVVTGIIVSGALSRALRRARCMAAERCSRVIPTQRPLTSVTPGSPSSFDWISRRISAWRGQPSVVSAMWTVTVPSGATVTSSTIPRSTMLAFSSGSSTPPSIPRTVSAPGSAGVGRSTVGSVMRGSARWAVTWSGIPNKTVSALKICPTGIYGQRMELEVLKALGDETRYALYRELAGSTAPRSAGELADALDLHANTVRLHLERLKDAGVVEVEVIHRGTVGRPQHRYSLAPGAPGLGFDPPAHVLLAGLLAALAETAGADPSSARTTGRAWGRQAADRG